MPSRAGLVRQRAFGRLLNFWYFSFKRKVRNIYITIVISIMLSFLFVCYQVQHFNIKDAFFFSNYCEIFYRFISMDNALW
jgi:hypothetical protein